MNSVSLSLSLSLSLSDTANPKFVRAETTGEAPVRRTNVSATLFDDQMVVLSFSDNKSALDVHTLDCSTSRCYCRFCCFCCLCRCYIRAHLFHRA